MSDCFDLNCNLRAFCTFSNSFLHRVQRCSDLARRLRSLAADMATVDMGANHVNLEV